MSRVCVPSRSALLGALRGLDQRRKGKGHRKGVWEAKAGCPSKLSLKKLPQRFEQGLEEKERGRKECRGY